MICSTPLQTKETTPIGHWTQRQKTIHDLGKIPNLNGFPWHPWILITAWSIAGHHSWRSGQIIILSIYVTKYFSKLPCYYCKNEDFKNFWFQLRLILTRNQRIPSILWTLNNLILIFRLLTHRNHRYHYFECKCHQTCFQSSSGDIGWNRWFRSGADRQMPWETSAERASTGLKATMKDTRVIRVVIWSSMWTQSTSVLICENSQSGAGISRIDTEPSADWLRIKWSLSGRCRLWMCHKRHVHWVHKSHRHCSRLYLSRDELFQCGRTAQRSLSH